MNECAARLWLEQHFDVPRETWMRLGRFVEILGGEASRQNLIAASTLDQVWSRHIVDSAQLIRFVDVGQAPTWLDLGSGAGFPGIVIALLTDFRITLVESRSKRVDYLQRVVAELELSRRVSVAGMPLERVPTQKFDVISARAFAPLPKLLALAARFSTDKTKWLLPKGRNAVNELEDARKAWELDFSVEPSVTDPAAGILVGRVRAGRERAGRAKPRSAAKPHGLAKGLRKR